MSETEKTVSELREEKRMLNEQKQVLYQKWVAARGETKEVREILNETEEELARAKTVFENETAALQEISSRFHHAQEQKDEVCRALIVQVRALQRKRSAEHNKMKTCFERAANARRDGRRAEVQKQSTKGQKHLQRHDKLEQQINGLYEQMQLITEQVRQEAPPADSTMYTAAKTAYQEAEKRHGELEKEYNQKVARERQLQKEFYSLNQKYAKVRDELEILAPTKRKSRKKKK